MPSQSTTLNPFFVSSLYEFTVVDVLYTGLFTFDKACTLISLRLMRTVPPVRMMPSRVWAMETTPTLD